MQAGRTASASLQGRADDMSQQKAGIAHWEAGCRHLASSLLAACFVCCLPCACHSPGLGCMVCCAAGQRALSFVLGNRGLIDKTLLFDVELMAVR